MRVVTTTCIYINYYWYMLSCLDFVIKFWYDDGTEPRVPGSYATICIYTYTYAKICIYLHLYIWANINLHLACMHHLYCPYMAI